MLNFIHKYQIFSFSIRPCIYRIAALHIQRFCIAAKCGLSKCVEFFLPKSTLLKIYPPRLFQYLGGAFTLKAPPFFILNTRCLPHKTFRLTDFFRGRSGTMAEPLPGRIQRFPRNQGWWQPTNFRSHKRNFCKRLFIDGMDPRHV